MYENESGERNVSHTHRILAIDNKSIINGMQQITAYHNHNIWGTNVQSYFPNGFFYDCHTNPDLPEQELTCVRIHILSVGL